MNFLKKQMNCKFAPENSIFNISLKILSFIRFAHLMQGLSKIVIPKVATHQALFWTNRKSAKALAIIQPGAGFGLKWTDFRDKT